MVVTRPGAGEDRLTRALAGLGADVRAIPMLVIGPPSDPEPFARALEGWSEYDWVAFTSPRGVSAVAEALAARGVRPAEHPPRRLAAVGPTTAAAARAVGWTVDLVPERFDADGLLSALAGLPTPLAGRRVLLPVAEAARETLGAGLRARGARVDRVAAYRSSAPPDLDRETAAAVFDEVGPLLLTLTSPSAARNLVDLLGADVLGVSAAAIGPVTGDAARALGFDVVVQPEEHTVEALVAAVIGWWHPRGGSAR